MARNQANPRRGVYRPGTESETVPHGGKVPEKFQGIPLPGKVHPAFFAQTMYQAASGTQAGA